MNEEDTDVHENYAWVHLLVRKDGDLSFLLSFKCSNFYEVEEL
jgi:hypothetical protein